MIIKRYGMDYDAVKTDYFCMVCGKKNVWTANATDFYEGDDYNCLECGSAWNTKGPNNEVEKQPVIANMTLAEKINWLESQSNEIAFGYDDSGCFWRIQYGPRGCGGMMENFGQKFCSESDVFEEAIDEFIAHLGERS